jgi:hypothetical protein
MQAKSRVLALTIFWLTSTAAVAAPEPQRQSEVAARGADVMPFDLQASGHVFTKSRNGGLQQVVLRNPRDAAQLRLVRKHLREIAARFEQGDFSAPAQIHGEQMPGLADLKQARPGEISIHYRDLPNGAQIRYATSNPALVPVLHQWFDAQLADHGADAMEGHEQHDFHRGGGR